MKPWFLLFAVTACALGQGSAENTGPKFEVASIRLHPPSVKFDGRSGPLTFSGTLLRLRGYTLFGLVMDAWNLHDYQLRFARSIPGEEFADVMYDVVARAPGETPPTPEAVRAMLRNLLIERFGITFHQEEKEMSIYALRVDKKGLKMKPGTGDAACTVKTTVAVDGRNTEDVFTNCTLDRLADRLTNLLGDHAVQDQTGVTGQFDFRLLVTPDFRTRIAAEATDISPISAVREAGLVLVPQKARVTIMTVDQIHKPAEN